MPVLCPQPAFAQDTAAATALKARIEAGPSANQRLADFAALRDFYAGRGWQPVWLDEQGPTRAGQLTISELRRAADWGLNERDFLLPALDVPKTAGAWTSGQAATADLEITRAVLEYAHQARGGRIPDPAGQLSSYLDRKPRLIDPAFVLVMVPTSPAPDAVLRSFHPQHEQFRKLQAAYSRLRQETSPGSATAPLPDTGPLLALGVRHADVRAVRARLNVAGEAENADHFDATLLGAVKAFQKTAGIGSDGLVGNRTRKALNAAKSGQNASTLRANMEQWRWMPEALGATHLFVNIPEFTVRVFERDAELRKGRVIVGKQETKTPIFSKAISTVVLRPTWKMPDSIKVEKLLWSRRRGRTLESQGYVIKKGRKVVDSTDVDWSKAVLSHYEFYQPSGDGNALGDVKFLFPNKHSVYLHDTPMKSLFKAEERLFSHGCMRLEDPLTYAQMLLDHDKGEGSFDVKALVSDGPEVNEIALETPVPIHIGYFTAWAGSDSAVQTFADAYGHEERIHLALEGRWDEIDKGVDHLAAVDTEALTGKRNTSAVRESPVSEPIRVAAKTRHEEPAAEPVNPAPVSKRFAAPMGLSKEAIAPIAKAAPVTAPVPAAKPQPKETPIAKLFKASSKPGKSRSDGGVGDIMRNALMNH